MSFRVAFTLEGDKDLIAALQKLHGRDVDLAVRIGMGKLKAKTKTEMKRAFTTYYNVSSGEVGKKIGKPQLRQEGGSTVLQVRGNAKPMSTRLFKPSMGIRHKNRQGVRYRIFKGGDFTRPARGFRQPSFAQGKPMQRVGDSRLPIRSLGAPSFHHAFTGGKYAGRIRAQVHKNTMPTLQRETKAALKGLARGFIR